MTDEQKSEEESLVRALVDNLPELAWTAQADGHIDFYNKPWYDYTGTTFAEMEGWGWEKIHDPAMLPRVAAQWNHSLQTGTPFEMEFQLRGADGTFRWFLTRVRPLRDAAGNIVRWFGINTDIDTVKKAAREREQLLAELQEALRFRELFVGILGHDLRNPLSAIHMCAQQLVRRGPTPQAVDLGRQILSGAQRMGRMIDQILDFTRLRVGAGIAVDVAPCDVADILQQVMKELETAYPETLITYAQSGDGQGLCDADRLAQVASNLLGNAIQHGDRGDRVQLSLATTDRELSFSVQNATCIEPDMLPVLFDPFRGSQYRHGKSRGLGLGLFISQQIVQAHRGVIDVTSDEASGTTFTVRLPRAVDPGVLPQRGVDNDDAG